MTLKVLRKHKLVACAVWPGCAPDPPSRAIAIVRQSTQHINVVTQISRSATEMLELKTRSTVEASQDRVARKTRQFRKLLLALVLLLVAIAVVVVADRQFWFGPDQLVLDSDGTEPAVAPATPTVPSAAQPSQPTTPPVAKKHVPVAKKQLPAAKPAAPKAANPPVVATTRSVLAPLDVDVVAGDSHRTVHPANKAAKIEITKPGSATSISAVTDAVGRERILSDAAQPQASYPLLAQNMNVQGSVVLQAIIGADGLIENIHVLSGPAILAAAAQQAVRAWRFKPVLQNGQPVETKANITVNFSIKVADSSKNS
jgi:protein TonB